MNFCWKSALCIAVLVALGAGTARAQEKRWFDPAATYRISAGDGPAVGAPGALVTIVEFSDFACPACRRLSRTLLHIRRLYGDRIRLVYRHNLLDPVDGTLAAEAAMAAGEQGAFWPAHDRLFAQPGPIGPRAVDRVARELGLDMARFTRAIDRGRFRELVRADERYAASMGMTSTPITFINGRPISGAQPLGLFVVVIEHELARAQALVDGGVAPAQVYEQIVAGGRTVGETSPVADARVAPVDPGRSYQVGLGADSHRRGSGQAAVTVVEFSDFACGFCQRVQPSLRRLEESYAGQLRLVYRHMPLLDGGGTLVAEAAMAAGEQGAFWAFHDRLFARRGRATREELIDIARELGIDADRFARAIDDRRFLGAVARDAAEAAALGVQGTPTFFINGRPVIGARPYAELASAVEEELARLSH